MGVDQSLTVYTVAAAVDAGIPFVVVLLTVCCSRYTVAAAVDAGIPFVVAAGNEARDACTRSPASEPKVVPVYI